jgi:hypothetical protein
MMFTNFLNASSQERIVRRFSNGSIPSIEPCLKDVRTGRKGVWALHKRTLQDTEKSKQHPQNSANPVETQVSVPSITTPGIALTIFAQLVVRKNKGRLFGSR